MAFSDEELQRYARHIVLPEFGGTGQQLLKQASVLVIGAGGLGSPVIQYLAAAGIGKLGIVDDDHVAISNLQRQTIHTTKNCGAPKVKSAEQYVEALNPNVEVVAYNTRFSPVNADELVEHHDFVVDGSDNFDTRYLSADTCEKYEKTLITAAVGQFDASITTLKPFEKDENGAFFPGYRDIFPVKPAAGLLPTCEEAGILGALTGIVGAMQAMETIKEIAGLGEGLAGRLLLFDAKSFRWQEIAYRRAECT